MKLKEVYISGYKSYGLVDEPIRFEDINIIIGANGAGKSNFISFLEMIAFIAKDDFSDYVAGSGYAASLIHARRERIDHIKGKLVFTDDQNRDEYSITIKQGVDGGLFISDETVVYQSPEYDQPYQHRYESAGKRTALIEASETDQTARIMLNILKGCRIYHFNDTSINAKMRMPGYIEDDRFLKPDAGNLAAYLYGIKNNPETKKHYQRISNMVREVFPRFDRFELHPRVNERGGESISLNWKEKGCDDIFGPHTLSDGTLRFIALSTLLLGPKDNRSEIIILDEPELGLHPHAIRVLAQIIKMVAGEIQVIIASQSRELLNEFEARQIIVAEFDRQKETSLLKRLDESLLEEWLAEYSLGELWDKNIIGGTP